MTTEIPAADPSQNQGAGGDKAASDPPTPMPTSGGVGTGNSDKKTKPRKHKRPHDAFEWTSLIVNGILAVATISAAAFAFWLAWLTHDLVNDARDATRDAHLDNLRAEDLTSEAIANATNNAIQQHADTLAAISRADVANKIAGGTARQQLRAYVTVPGASIDNFGTTSEPTGVTVVLKNVGNTPAYKLSGKFYIAYVEAPFSSALPATIPRKTPAPTMTLAPGDPFYGHDRTKVPLIQPEIDAIRAGKAELLVWGVVSYLDTFHTPHKTVFRLTFGGENPVTNDGALHPDKTGNNSD